MEQHKQKAKTKDNKDNMKMISSQMDKTKIKTQRKQEEKEKLNELVYHSKNTQFYNKF